MTTATATKRIGLVSATKAEMPDAYGTHWNVVLRWPLVEGMTPHAETLFDLCGGAPFGGTIETRERTETTILYRVVVWRD